MVGAPGGLIISIARRVLLLLVMSFLFFVVTYVFVSLLTYIGVSMPSFVLSIFLLLFFAVFLRASPLNWGSPLFGMHGGGQEDLGDLAFHMVLPVTTIKRDYPMVLDILVAGAFTVVLNLVADVLYAVVDPRIRY